MNGCQRLRRRCGGLEVGVAIKGARRNPCGDVPVPSLDSINVNIQAVTLYSSFSRCYC